MPEPFPAPAGLRLSQAARAVSRAFDEALAAAGGSLPVWLILLNLKVRRPGTQRELAEAVGIREATLTHHLNAMDADGLVTRVRDAANRRVQVVTLTDQGDQMFLALRAAATAFDTRLNAGFSQEDQAVLADLLSRLRANVGVPGSAPAGPPSLHEHQELRDRPGLTESRGAGHRGGRARLQQRQIARRDDRGQHDGRGGAGDRGG